jgi:HK97 gp10 family phage protein
MNGIEVNGLDELTEFFEEMTLTEADERKAMKKAMEPVAKQLETDTPKGSTKKLSKVKISIVREDFATVGKIRLGAWWDIFQEFGTSKSKKNAGFFERSINSTNDKAIGILANELLNKK